MTPSARNRPSNLALCAYLSTIALCAVALTGRWWAATGLVALFLIRTPESPTNGDK